jgi:stress-induced morphogen
MMKKTIQYDMRSLYAAHPVKKSALKAAANLLRMPSTGEIAALIEQALPGSKVQVEDMGGGDHLYAHVVAPQFDGLSLIQQHTMVNGAVEHLLGPGRPIHALKIKTEVGS